MSGAGDGIEALLPYRMNRGLARLNRGLTERLRAVGHTFQDWRLLAILWTHDGATINQLAEAAVLPQPTASRLAAKLEEDGLVARSGDHGDQRKVVVTLTDKGRAAYRVMLPHAIAEYEAAMAGFTAEERRALFGAVDRMAANVGMSYWPES